MRTTAIRILICILCVIMLSVMTSCGGAEITEPIESKASNIDSDVKKFTFIVRDANGNEAKLMLESKREFLLEALLDEGLVDGEAQEAGFYVKQVNGIVADYDKDQSYWALYIDGEYAMTGADTTPIEEGKTYVFAVEK